MLSDTELRLSFWRDGSTKAERLAGAALRLSGYEEIDPQSPLGGPDGKKDILCRKGGLSWVAAVHFPTGPTRFGAIKKKFKSGLDGALAEHRGFVFVTNQTLTPTQRKTLTELTLAASKEADIIHLQQLQNLLDSAPGYGVRIQYLGIAMSIEEQLSWASESDSQTARAGYRKHSRAVGRCTYSRRRREELQRILKHYASSGERTTLHFEIKHKNFKPLQHFTLNYFCSIHSSTEMDELHGLS